MLIVLMQSYNKLGCYSSKSSTYFNEMSHFILAQFNDNPKCSISSCYFSLWIVLKWLMFSGIHKVRGQLRRRLWGAEQRGHRKLCLWLSNGILFISQTSPASSRQRIYRKLVANIKGEIAFSCLWDILFGGKRRNMLQKP